MALERVEQETVIWCAWGAETMTLSTSNPAHAKAMRKLGYEPKISRVPTKYDVTTDKKGREVRTATEHDEVTWTFTLPSEYFKLPRPKKRVSDEQRAARSERMKKRGD